MIRALASLAIVCLSFVLNAQPAGGPEAFQRLRALDGEWEGTLEWTGARTGTGKVHASYHPTGNDSAMIEDLIMSGTVPSMTSVYHLDGSDLRMTHYCGAHNQPRLKATRIDQAQGTVQFAFVDGTDLAAHPAHVDAFEIRFVSADHLALRFTFVGGGKTSIEHIELDRVRAPRAG